MRIGIDARMLGFGYGIGRYIEQLITHLFKIDRENEYVLILDFRFSRSVRDPASWRWQILDFIKRFQIPDSRFQIVTVDIPWYSWSEQMKLKPIIKKAKVDLMHFPHWNVPLTYSDPFVVTIHDLIMFHYPRPEATTLGPVKFWAKDKVHRLVLRHAVRAAKHIITTSEFTKEDVHQTLGVPMEKMTVTYQAPFEDRESRIWNLESGINFKSQITNSKQILPPSGGTPLKAVANSKFQILNSYILYVGAAYPHKNLEGLLKAWTIFQEKYGGQYQLVLVGKEDYFWRRLKTNELIFKLSNSLIFTDLVSDEELSHLYKNASLFIFPSLYEGFGLPPLEAMAHGVPIVSSNRTCLPEVLGEAALYFDPENYAQMAEVIHRALTDDEIRFALKENAREELRRYSWEKLARETLKAYMRVSGEDQTIS